MCVCVLCCVVYNIFKLNKKSKYISAFESQNVIIVINIEYHTLK